MKISRSIALAFCLVAVLAGSAAMAASNFVTVSLPKGVSYQLPSNWKWFSNSSKVTLGAHVEAKLTTAKLDASGDLQFAANLYDDKGTTIGITNVRFYPEQTVTQEEIRAFTAADMAELNVEMRKVLNQSATVSGFQIIAWTGTTAKDINGKRAVVTEYMRTSIVAGQPPFSVRLVRVLNGPKSFTVTMSYRIDHAKLLGPIADYVISTVRS